MIFQQVSLYQEGKNYCSMAIHSISTTSLLYLLMNVFDRKTTFTYATADDITSGGKIENLRKWWKFLSSYDLLFGYYSQSHKSLTVMKEVQRQPAKGQFYNININVAIAGKQHIGTDLRGRDEKQNQKSQHKQHDKDLKHFIVFISQDINPNLLPINGVIHSKLIRAITGGHVCSKKYANCQP